MRFDVRAIDDHQQLHSLHLDALDIVDANAQLAARQLTALSLKTDTSMRHLAWGSNRNSRFDLLLFAQELHALVVAGLSVVEALEALIERTTADTTRSVLQRLLAHLREGQRLSSSLAHQGTVFPPLFTGMIQAAEGTSDLPRSLERYIAYEIRLQVLRHKITSAAIYPSILMGVGGAVASFLLGYVVPRFATVYKGSGKPLPWASQMLLNWGEFASNYAPGLLAAVIALAIVIIWASRRALKSGGWWRILAWLPGAQPRLKVLELSRLYLTMGMLLEGGIPVARAMQLSEAVVKGPKVQALIAARASVGQGYSLSQSLEQQQLSTPVALRLILVGEKTGQLGNMLSRTAAFYDSETTRWIERFTKSFEPILMAAIGIVIGLIVILLYMPIFDLAGNLQ